jgi:hypothetical protein
MHFPGANVLLIFGIFLMVLGFLPMFMKAYKNDPARPQKFLNLALITIVIGTIVIHSISSTNSGVVESFPIVDERLNTGNVNLNEINSIIYSGLSNNIELPDSTKQKIKKVHQLRVDLYDYIGRMKSELYVRMHIPAEVADSFKLMQFGAKENIDIPARMLIGEDPQRPREGSFSALELKNKIAVLKIDLLSLVKDEQKAELANMIGLSTESVFNDDIQMAENWESYYFWNVPAVTVITTLSQLQAEVLYSEFAVMSFLNSANVKPDLHK